MPELPEVEVCRRGLLPGVAGAASGPGALSPVARGDPENLGELLAGPDRRRQPGGPVPAFDCRARPIRGWLIVHLGMTGNLRLVVGDRPPGRHDHVDLVFDDGVLRFSDPRRFGVVTWHPGPTLAAIPLLAGQGIEPLSAAFDGAWLYAATRRRSGPIKTVLMDAHTVVGVGNIYAAESLFSRRHFAAAGGLPHRPGTLRPAGGGNQGHPG